MKIGIDIEEVSRFENKDKSFYERIFSPKEIEYCISKPNPAQHFCARFCAKEALVKALSDKSLKYNEIEVINDENGAPCMKYKNFKIAVSLSHCKDYACANVLVLG